MCPRDTYPMIHRVPSDLTYGANITRKVKQDKIG